MHPAFPLSITETVIKDLLVLTATGQMAAREWLIGQEDSHRSR